MLNLTLLLGFSTAFDCATDETQCTRGVLAEYWRQCQGGQIIHSNLRTNEKPDVVRIESTLNYSSHSAHASWVEPKTGDVLPFADLYAARFTGWVDTSTHGKGTYQFSLESDDGSELYIGKEHVVEDGGLHGMTTHKGSIYLGMSRWL